MKMEVAFEGHVKRIQLKQGFLDFIEHPGHPGTPYKATLWIVQDDGTLEFYKLDGEFKLGSTGHEELHNLLGKHVRIIAPKNWFLRLILGREIILAEA